ncbi:MAG: FAD-binding protein [Proteobacteria bacterium]|jgi:squalene-associated FAD-dependent desaturase|nr:hydroxysqualene dehydroxylase HpnE [Alphaproteobacteria bacterium]NCC02728.1 FAD-binding protein [Pseudomonadota bacterium]
MIESRQIHIIGAGLAGLSAALQLTLMGEKVTVYEAAPYAGGRCRSYFDKGLDCRIDNGNHIVLSGNVAVHDYLELSGAQDTVIRHKEPIFPFMDLQTGERWILRMNNGLFPRWIFDPKRRVPGTTAKDYLSASRLFFADEKDTVANCLDTRSVIYKRLWEPMAIASLNTEVENASARLLANLLAQSFAAGGKACQPIIPKVGLSETFVTPCIGTLREHGTEIKFSQRLQGIDVTSEGQVMALRFHQNIITIGPKDWVILAVPAWVAQEIIPNLLTPTSFRAIANAHFRVEAPQNLAGFTGLIGGLAEWVFVKPGVVSVTVSAADRYEEQDQEKWAIAIWDDLARLFDLDPGKIPPCRIIREKRATFAATPEQDKMRPTAYIGWKNLALAGDWTATSLPSTIEGALRSGVKAAQVVMRWAHEG